SDTGAPTGSDTGAPTGSDTGAPTGSDTGVPTGSDTGAPTGSDTGLPTGSDTGVPTGSDTGVPTGSDTGVPSASDSGVPSMSTEPEGLTCSTTPPGALLVVWTATYTDTVGSWTQTQIANGDYRTLDKVLLPPLIPQPYVYEALAYVRAVSDFIETTLNIISVTNLNTAPQGYVFLGEGAATCSNLNEIGDGGLVAVSSPSDWSSLLGTYTWDPEVEIPTVYVPVRIVLTYSPDNVLSGVFSGLDGLSLVRGSLTLNPIPKDEPPVPSASASDSSVPSGVPTGSDTGVPTGSDTGAPTGSDTGAPTGSDTGAPTGSDTGVPTGSDTGAPTGSDTGAPTGSDTGAPTGSDTGVPTGSDTGVLLPPLIPQPYVYEALAYVRAVSDFIETTLNIISVTNLNTAPQGYVFLGEGAATCSNLNEIGDGGLVAVSSPSDWSSLLGTYTWDPEVEIPTVYVPVRIVLTYSPDNVLSGVFSGLDGLSLVRGSLTLNPIPKDEPPVPSASASDSSVPSGVPTGSDTGVPTGSDTGAPTGSDTGAPTGSDTGAPTGSDTGVPTGSDTGVPTGSDTGVPSASDSGVPSMSGEPEGLTCSTTPPGALAVVWTATYTDTVGSWTQTQIANGDYRTLDKVLLPPLNPQPYVYEALAYVRAVSDFIETTLNIISVTNLNTAPQGYVFLGEGAATCSNLNEIGDGGLVAVSSPSDWSSLLGTYTWDPEVEIPTVYVPVRIVLTYSPDNVLSGVFSGLDGLSLVRGSLTLNPIPKDEPLVPSASASDSGVPSGAPTGSDTGAPTGSDTGVPSASDSGVPSMSGEPEGLTCSTTPPGALAVVWTATYTDTVGSWTQTQIANGDYRTLDKVLLPPLNPQPYVYEALAYVRAVSDFFETTLNSITVSSLNTAPQGYVFLGEGAATCSNLNEIGDGGLVAVSSPSDWSSFLGTYTWDPEVEIPTVYVPVRIVLTYSPDNVLSGVTSGLDGLSLVRGSLTLNPIPKDEPLVPSASASASGVPSAGVTGGPSASASDVPSAGVTGGPSASASGVPSASVTGGPSASASGVPSASVTGAPSASTSGAPSVSAGPGGLTCSTTPPGALAVVWTASYIDTVGSWTPAQIANGDYRTLDKVLLPSIGGDSYVYEALAYVRAVSDFFETTLSSISVSNLNAAPQGYVFLGEGAATCSNLNQIGNGGSVTASSPSSWSSFLGTYTWDPNVDIPTTYVPVRIVLVFDTNSMLTGVVSGLDGLSLVRSSLTLNPVPKSG
ncbi:hypothetical protein CANCADRAFT_1284, partial [Tortispora caseinolytica NRRL Y-17796]